MRWLRTIALAIGLWALLAAVYFQFILYKRPFLGMSLPRSPALIELETRKAQRLQQTATYALAASLVCLSVDSLIRVLRPPRTSEPAGQD